MPTGKPQAVVSNEDVDFMDVSACRRRSATCRSRRLSHTSRILADARGLVGRRWVIIQEIWLICYKKATKKPSIDYEEAVEEAICFGWIDNLEKGMDAERYALRFSPRKPKSNWTNTTKDRARKMIAEGRMTPAGKAALPPDVQAR